MQGMGFRVESVGSSVEGENNDSKQFTQETWRMWAIWRMWWQYCGHSTSRCLNCSSAHIPNLNLVEGLWFRVYGSGLRVWGLGCRA